MRLCGGAASRAAPVFWQTASAWFRDPLPADRYIEKLNPAYTDVHSFPSHLF
jgi:hypothetical protein